METIASINLQGKSLWTCIACREDFPSNNLLQRHVCRAFYNVNCVTSFVPESHFCNFCGQTFDKEGPFRQHLVGHFKKKLHECDICNSSFSGPYFLKQHMKVHIQARPFVCSHCGTGYRKKDMLIKHFRIHGVPQMDTPVKQLFSRNTTEPRGTMSATMIENDANIFNGTNAVMGMKSNISNFMELTHINESQSASGPPQRSNADWTPSNLLNGDLMPQVSVQNQLSHPILQESLQVKESQLGVQIPVPPNLQSFQRPFSVAETVPRKKKRAYPCDICHKTFTVRAHCVRHRRLHTGEMPFECETCKRKFMWKSSLVTHSCFRGNKHGRHRNSTSVDNPGDGVKNQEREQGWSEELNTTIENSQVNSEKHQRHGVSEANGERRENRNTTNMFICGQCGENFTKESLLHSHMSVHNEGLPDVECHKPSWQDSPTVSQSREGESTAIPYNDSQSLLPSKDAVSNKISNISKEISKQKQGAKKWKLNCRARVVLPKLIIPPDKFGYTSHRETAKKKQTKVFVCEFCNKVSLNRNHYARHKRIHTGETPYECDKCDRKFRWKSSLDSHKKSHMRNLHMDNNAEESIEPAKDEPGWTSVQAEMDSDETFICVQCGLSFSTELELQCHAPIHDINLYATASVSNGDATQSETETFSQQRSMSSPSHLKICKTENLDPNPDAEEASEAQDKVFTCGDCQKVFRKHPAYLRHLRIHTEKLPFQCDQCGMRLKWRTSLDVHKETHNVSSSVDPFGDARHFGDLITEHHEHASNENETELSQAFECLTCGLEFCSETELEFHMSIHEDIKCERGTVLGMVTDTAGLSGDRNDEPQQDKVESPKILNPKIPHSEPSHSTLGMLDVVPVPPQRIDVYVCEVCSKTFSNKSHYIRHKRVHTEEMPYQCDQCDRSFKWSSSLLAHKKSHANKDALLGSENMSNFPNELTHRKSESIPELRVESVEVLDNNIPKPFVCPQCGKDFVTDSQLQIHMFIHGDEEYLQRGFAHATPATDQLSPPGIPSRPSLLHVPGSVGMRSTRDTAKSVSPNRKQDTGKGSCTCDVCGKVFKTLHQYRRHMPIHTGEMPFQCDRCNKRFKWKSSLDSHMNSHFRRDSSITSIESMSFINTDEEME